ncbi:MAG: hypothetical protein ABJE95_32575 [Byssovorax sp.]
MIDYPIVPRPVHLKRAAPSAEPEPILLLAIDRGAAGELRIQLRSFAGRRVVDVRLYERRAGAEPRATDKGIALRWSELVAVARALGAALTASPAFEERGRS